MSKQTGSEYILHCRSLSFSDAEISAEMRRVGWQDVDIHAAFAQADASAHGKPTKKSGSKMWLWIVISVVTVVVLGGLASTVYFLYSS